MDTSIIIDTVWSRIKWFLLSLMWRFHIHLTMAVAGQNTQCHSRSMTSLWKWLWNTYLYIYGLFFSGDRSMQARSSFLILYFWDNTETQQQPPGFYEKDTKIFLLFNTLCVICYSKGLMLRPCFYQELRHSRFNISDVVNYISWNLASILSASM